MDALKSISTVVGLSYSLSISAAILIKISKQSEKNKRANLYVIQKLEIIQKLKMGASVANVCERYGVKKQKQTVLT